MKRLLLIVLPLLLIVGCEDEKDTEKPTITITFPQNNTSVSEMVSITCISSDNEGVDKVELWVNGVTTELTDDTEPYSFDWNTTLVDNGNYTITVRSYDLSGNTTDSETLILTVHNPTEVTLWGVVYSIENTTNLNLSNNQLTGSIPPEIGLLTNLTSLSLYRNDITGSIPSEIGNLTNLTDLRLDNNQLTGEIPSEIGNLSNLTSLVLDRNQLTGSIPPEIGNLTSLTSLYLSNNQLTGIIPDEICNHLAFYTGMIGLGYNQLCPPYPSCVEVDFDYNTNSLGEQDTSNCD